MTATQGYGGFCRRMRLERGGTLLLYGAEPASGVSIAGIRCKVSGHLKSGTEDASPVDAFGVVTIMGCSGFGMLTSGYASG